jgi:hypothetical protein
MIGRAFLWYTIEIKMVLSMTNRYEVKDKIEVLTANYPISRDMIEDQQNK